MKTFIAVMVLGLSVGAMANASNTKTPGYNDPAMNSQPKTSTSDSLDMDQQRMEESKMKSKTTTDESMDSMDGSEKVRTIDAPTSAPMEDSSTTTKKKNSF